MHIDYTHVIAAVVTLFAMRSRIRVKWAKAGDSPGVDPAQFVIWKATALRGYHIAAGASVAKTLFDVVWMALGSRAVTAMGFMIGGSIVTFTWIVALVYAWWLTTEAGGMREKLGIELTPEKST